jgi:hypothetical protein
VHSARRHPPIVDQHRDGATVQGPGFAGTNQGEPFVDRPAELRLFESHRERAAVPQGLDGRDDLLATLAQVVRELHQERSWCRFDLFENWGLDGAEGEGAREGSVPRVLDPFSWRAGTLQLTAAGNEQRHADHGGSTRGRQPRARHDEARDAIPASRQPCSNAANAVASFLKCRR